MKCKEIKKDGQQCGREAEIDEEYCSFHLWDGEAQRVGRLGGQTKIYKYLDAEKFTLSDTASWAKLLSQCAKIIGEGKMPPKVGTALGFLASKYLELIEFNELKSKLIQIEKTINESK